MRERKVVIVNSEFEGDIDEKVSRSVAEHRLGGWGVCSASTSVTACPKYNQQIYVQWCTTLVFEREKK